MVDTFLGRKSPCPLTWGRICIGRRKINLSQVFAGQNVGIKEVAEKIWLVSFMHYDLGFFDHEAGRVECAPNPFGAKVLLGLNGSTKHLSREYTLVFSIAGSPEVGYSTSWTLRPIELG